MSEAFKSLITHGFVVGVGADLFSGDEVHAELNVF